MAVHARRSALQRRFRRPAQSALSPRFDQLLPVLGHLRHGALSLCLLRDRRRRRLQLGRRADARAVVRRRRVAQHPPLRLRRLRHHDAAAHGAPLRVQPPAWLPLVLVGDGRAADLARLRGGHHRLHAAVGPPRAVHDHRLVRVDRLAARLRRRADAQLHLPRQRHRPLLLAARLHAHRHLAAVAAAAVGARAARAEGPHQPAAHDHGEPARDAAAAWPRCARC